MDGTSEGSLIEVQCPEDIPEFANEDEEHAFWSTNCIGERFVKRVGLLPLESRPAYRLLQNKSATNPPMKHGNIPL